MTLLFPKKRKAGLKELSGAKMYLKHLHCNLKLPKKAVICPLSSLTKYALSQGKFKHFNCEADIYAEEQKGFCYVTGFGVGAPALAMALEVLIGLGVKEFVFVGLAGSLQPEVLAGDIVLCDGALADEGVSAHYVPQEFLRPCAALTKKLAGVLQKANLSHHTGPNWTTDAMFRETAEKGLVLSEYPPEVKAERFHFPVRNRIIAALGEGLLVVSAGKRSGTAYTAGYTEALSRQIFALPYNVNVPSGEGCNEYIRQGAILTTCPEDILDFYKIEGKKATADPLTEEEREIYDVIRQEGEIHIDAIAERTGKRAFELMPVLGILEIRKMIIRQAGNVYCVL